MPFLDSQLQTIIRPAKATPEQGAIIYSKTELTSRVLS
jgi:glucosamine kinase